MTIKTNTLVASLLLFALLGITIAVYWIGLASPFLLDDIPNLQNIGQHNELGMWRDLALYILQGHSGFLGRPLSMASFYLNDQSWPGMSSTDFKYTNLMLHLLNGVLLFWLCLKLLPRLPLPTDWKQWLPLLATAAWLLNPMHINTVLYAVQRMTELGALFTLTGLLCYLQGRDLLQTRPSHGWLWLAGGGGLSLLLALLSKENGILLVLYVLVLEYTLLRPLGSLSSRSLNIALGVFAWLPLALLCLMLIKWGWIDHTSRPFTTVERLMTETRILWDYLGRILLPRMGDNSLLRDDYAISHNLFNPITTLPAILGILGAILLAWRVRQRLPVLSFGILWFLGGHMLESTTIALELYFDHRNYLPMFGPVFALAYYSLYAMQRSAPLHRIIPAALALYIGLTAFVTHNIAQQWSDPPRLIAGWLEYHPKSLRTLESLDALIGNRLTAKTRHTLLAGLDQLAQQQNAASYLVFRNLKLACEANTLTPDTLPKAVEQLRRLSYMTAAEGGFADFTQTWTATHCGGITAEQMIAFIQQLRTITQLQQEDMPYLLHYWQASVHVQQGNLAEAMQQFDMAYSMNKNIDTLLLQASYLISAGLYTEAENKLANAPRDFCDTGNWQSCLTLEMRQPDFDNLLALLKKQQKANNHAQAVNYSARQE